MSNELLRVSFQPGNSVKTYIVRLGEHAGLCVIPHAVSEWRMTAWPTKRTGLLCGKRRI